MAETIKQGDFVQVEYSGRLADDGTLFDTTDEAAAKKAGIGGKNAKYGPATICIGEHHLIRGIDEELTEKAVGQQYTFTLPAERAFGKKDAKLIQLIPTQKFMKEGIRPMPGLQITVDNMLGMVKSVSGGRTLVDFNHPLAGRDVRYEVKVLKKVTDATEKLKMFVARALQLPDAPVTVKEGDAEVQLPFALPEELRGEAVEKIKKAIPELKNVTFQVTEK